MNDTQQVEIPAGDLKEFEALPKQDRDHVVEWMFIVRRIMESANHNETINKIVEENASREGFSRDTIIAKYYRFKAGGWRTFVRKQRLSNPNGGQNDGGASTRWSKKEEIGFINGLSLRSVVGYLKGIKQRVVGFNGGPMAESLKDELIGIAVARLNLLESR